MGRPAIVEKLSREFQERIASERQVVYILAEIRKLLERDNKKREYPALNFYCDWALHAKIDRNQEARRVVEVFDTVEKLQTLMDNTPEGGILKNPDWSWLDTFHKEVDLSKFRVEFCAFCRQVDIEGALLEDDGEWLHFLNHYSGVIEDIPLVFVDHTLRYVKEVSIKRIPFSSRAGTGEPEDAFVIQWEWSSPSGEDRMSQKVFHLPTPPHRVPQQATPVPVTDSA